MVWYPLSRAIKVVYTSPLGRPVHSDTNSASPENIPEVFTTGDAVHLYHHSVSYSQLTKHILPVEQCINKLKTGMIVTSSFNNVQYCKIQSQVQKGQIQSSTLYTMLPLVAAPGNCREIWLSTMVCTLGIITNTYQNCYDQAKQKL